MTQRTLKTILRPRNVVIGILLVGISIQLIVWFWRPGTLLALPNQGHRLGGDVIEDLPENTIASFRRAIEQLESRSTYLYSECDLRETKDGEIVIFHDWDLARLVPDSKENRAAIWGDGDSDESILSLPICDLTLEQLSRLRLKNGHRIPTLEDVLIVAQQLKLTKPLILEIKYLHSDLGRQKVIETATRFRDESNFEIHFSSFRRNIKRSFPDPKSWLAKFSQSGFRVYQVFRPKTESYDLCETW